MDSCIKQNWKFIQRTQKRGIPNDVASTLKKKKTEKMKLYLFKLVHFLGKWNKAKKYRNNYYCPSKAKNIDGKVNKS